MRRFIPRIFNFKPYFDVDCIAMSDEEFEVIRHNYSNEPIIREDELEHYRTTRYGVSLYDYIDGKIVTRSESDLEKGRLEEILEELEMQIGKAKEELKKTDWCVIKCTELSKPLQKNYPVIFTERVVLRERINDLEREGERILLALEKL